MKLINRHQSALLAALALTSVASLVPQSASAQIDPPPSFAFSKTRSRLVVLLHGVTPKPEQAPEQYIGKTNHARYYWGFDFIKGLQGYRREDQMRVITPRKDGTFRFETYSAKTWNPPQGLQSDNDLAPICFPIRWWTNIQSTVFFNTIFTKHYIRLMSKEQGADATMVMVNTRDGSKHFMPQLAETIDEVYESYQAAFGSMREAEQPQIYLVGHSFGGILARGIIAAPSGADLWGNKLTRDQIDRARYLRNRVVLVKTIAAPHHGTHIGDVASDAHKLVQDKLPSIIEQVLEDWPDLTDTEGYNSDQRWAKANELTKFVTDAISGDRDCLEDLGRMEEINQLLLGRNTMRRSDNTYVPMYVAAGRNPGDQYYDVNRKVWSLVGGFLDFHPVNTFDELTGTRFTSNAAALNLIEGIMHAEGYGREGKKPWGTATLAAGDKVSSPWRGYGPDRARALEAPFDFNWDRIKDVFRRFLDGNPFEVFKQDGEWDNDGFLAWDSANALNLPGTHIYRLYDSFQFGYYLPWDVDNHGSIMFNGANGQWIHNELLRNAGPVVIDGARTSGWRYNEWPSTPSNSIKMTISKLEDVHNNVDPFNQADFDMEVTMGGIRQTINCQEDTRTIVNFDPFYLYNAPNTVIPITIKVTDRDNGDDDICCLSPKPGSTTLHLYYDTRTNLISGDMNAEGGTFFKATPNKYVWRDDFGTEPGNVVAMNLKIEKIN